MPTIATHTLGCKLNFAETSHLVREFTQANYTVVDYHQFADLYVINTCTVTSVAEKKCRNAIRQAITQNPAAIVAVIGCFAQNGADQIAQIPGVSIILGNDQKHKLLEIVESYQSKTISDTHSFCNTDVPQSFQLSYSGGDRTRTFFKIQDGCDYFCTYCAIPFARGRSRSATIEETVAMAKQISLTGTKEVVLTGVNTGTFGQRHGESFFDLLKALDQIEGILRYRISSIEPNLITDEIIDFVAQSRSFLPHFHIPLQSASDKVLKMMHRRYDTALYANRLQHIKSVMPDACIAADVITGFNGETDEEFEKAYHLLEELPISYLHVFPYSDRPNTAALKLPEKVAVPIRKERCLKMNTLSNMKRHQFVMSQMGKVRKVLWEHSEHTTNQGLVMEGWTDNYIRLQRPFDIDLAGTTTSFEINESTIVDNFTCED